MYDQNLRTRMATMSPQQLKQFAMMHKDDPFVVSMALDIDNTRKAGQRQQAMQAVQQPQPKVVDQTLASIGQPEMPQQERPMQAAPQMQAGLPQLPAQNIASMADGGIAGYAEGKEVKGGRDEYRAYAMKKAQEMGLDPSFVDGIFKIESNYDPKAKSKTGPQGIGQLTEYIAKTFGISPKDRLDPYKNIDASMGFMDYLNKKYKGDKAKMAVAYNQGEPVLDAHLKQNKGQLVPENLHLNVKTANKNEPANYLKKMTDAGAITPVQTAGTREAPRTPEMLARQKEALRRREVAEYLPLSAAQAGETSSRDPSQPSLIDKIQRAAPPALGGKGELVSEVFGKNRPAAPPAPVPVAEPRAGAFFPPNMLNPDIGKTMAGAPVEGIQALQGGRYAAASVPGTPEAAAADKVRAAALAKAEKDTSFMDRIYGGAEALHGLALGYPAMATGLINLPSVQNFLAPKTEKGKEYSADLHKLLVEEGKLPPYIPSLGVSRPKALTPEAIAKSAEATKRAETATVNAETAAAPRISAPATSGRAAPDVLAGYRTNPATGEVTPRFAMEQPRTFNIDPAAAEFGALSVRDRLLRDQAADVVKAKEVAARLGEKADVAGDEVSAARLLDEQNTGIQRLQTNAPKVATAVGSGATTLPVTPVEEAARTKPHVAFSEEPGYGPYKTEKTDEVPIEERSRTATPEKKTGLGALSDEDYLMMGLNMLQAPAGQTGNALSQLGQNIGRSGLATLGAKREREKTLADQMQKQALSDYYKGMTEQFGKEPERIREARILEKEPNLMDVMGKIEANKDITGQRARILQVYDAGVASGSIDPNKISRDQFLAEYGGMNLGTDLFQLSPKGMEAFKKYK